MADETTVATAPGAAPGPGWAKVFGFLDGIGGAADRVSGIIDTTADAAEDIARGRGAIHQEQQAKQQADLDMMLQLQGFERGDNRLTIFAVGAAAVAVIVLFAK